MWSVIIRPSGLSLDYLLEDEEAFAELATSDRSTCITSSLGLVLEPRAGVFKPSSLIAAAGG